MRHRLLLQIKVRIADAPLVADSPNRHYKMSGQGIQRQSSLELALPDSSLSAKNEKSPTSMLRSDSSVLCTDMGAIQAEVQ